MKHQLLYSPFYILYFYLHFSAASWSIYFQFPLFEPLYSGCGNLELSVEMSSRVREKVYFEFNLEMK